MSMTRADRTAIRRNSLSRPVALAVQDNVVRSERTFFDYGCGRGDDLLRLHKMGVPVSGWDPAFFPEEERKPADVVNLGYVVNVVEDPEERVVVLTAAWSLTRKVLIVSARLDWEATDTAVDFQSDGIVTGKRTFQKFFTQEELRQWIERAVGRRPIAAAPGVFYVFRDETDEQSFVANRVFRQRGIPGTTECQELVTEHRDLIDPLITFVDKRGRLPVDGELSTAPQLIQIFGSVPRAFLMLRRLTGTDRWKHIRQLRRDDLLVYLALAAFPKRPRFSVLPDELRHDIRAFFGSYKAACAASDRLLFSAGNQALIDEACRRASVGKLLPDALYVHHTAVNRLPSVLRVYEGCGHQLAGSVDRLTLVKLFRRRARVSFLAYEDFDGIAHPALQTSIIADLKCLDLHFRDYTRSSNPPVLHRKELLVADDYPRRPSFARLTAREECFGLLDSPAAIGTREQWHAVLSARHLVVRGHRLTSEP